MICNACPRKCNAIREYDKASNGFCKMPYNPAIARAALHFWEEPCISGKNGSGTIFFSGCSLRCMFCQNEEISRSEKGNRLDVDGFIDLMKRLEDKGANNINLVNPTHFAPFIRSALEKYKPKIPVVYNTGGYDTVSSIKSLNGIIDVYLPDLKYFDSEVSKKYSSAPDYFENASQAILEMYHQTGECVFNTDGIIKSGVIIRHLILPGNIEQSYKVLDWIAQNLPKTTYISLMSQYTPMTKYEKHPELNRRLTTFEYQKVLKYFERLGFENGYMQQINSAEKQYIPDFSDFGI